MTATLTKAAVPGAPIERRPDERVHWRTSGPFLAAHLVPLAAVVTGVSTRAVVLCVVCYVGRMLCITAGYHRYLSHRSFSTSRVVQLLLAFGGTTAAQKGPLWWASQHRTHHRFTDQSGDPHTPAKGFWYAHVGWVLAECNGRTDLKLVEDLARFPELRFLDRHDWIGPWALAIACTAIGGWSGLVVGFFLSTVLLWHATFAVNSFAHVFGRRRYTTGDTSRNSVVVALLAAGEGWHNNHHRYPRSARQGQRWWELDPTWWALRLAAAVGLVGDLRRGNGPPSTSSTSRATSAGE
jgi:stearoyl-CoA desaturase (delta-9 desaturase)